MRATVSLQNRYRIVALALAVLLSFLSLSSCVTEYSREDMGFDVPAFNDTTDDPDTRPRVAITFDDGPNHFENRTKNYVDELNKYGYHATFFVVGNRILGGDAVKYAVDNGMEIGIHGYTHNVYYNDCTAEAFNREMQMTLDEIHKQVPDYEVKLMRPIGGAISAENAAICPYAIIHWSVDSDDWNNRYHPGDTEEDWNATVNTIVNNVLSKVKEGDIILMHDIYESTYDATVIILQRLNEMGYNVVSVSELLGQTEAGILYHKK